MKLDELRKRLRSAPAQPSPVRARTQAEKFAADFLEARDRYDAELRLREHYYDCAKCHRPFFAPDKNFRCPHCEPLADEDPLSLFKGECHRCKRTGLSIEHDRDVMAGTTIARCRGCGATATITLEALEELGLP